MALLLAMALVAFGIAALGVVVQAIRQNGNDAGLDRVSASVARERDRRDAAGRDAATRAGVAGADGDQEAGVNGYHCNLFI